MITVLFWFFIAFTLLWVGSGIAVKTISKISHSLATSSFFTSFFILGLFTSITEIMIGINSLIENKPEIYVGNLLGSTAVVYLLIIPLLAVLGNGVKLNHSLNIKGVMTAALVGGFPALLTLDNKFGGLDAVLCIILYSYFVFMLDKSGSLLDRIFHKKASKKTLVSSFIKLSFAVLLVFVGSHILVVQTPNLAQILGISPFIVSILLISIGTNIPEISIAIRSILEKHKDIAFGNYLGSASLNTLEIGVLNLLGRTTVEASGSNFSVMALILGLLLFVYFIKSRNDLSKKEGRILLGCYFLFVCFELFAGSGWSLYKL